MSINLFQANIDNKNHTSPYSFSVYGAEKEPYFNSLGQFWRKNTALYFLLSKIISFASICKIELGLEDHKAMHQTESQNKHEKLHSFFGGVENNGF